MDLPNCCTEELAHSDCAANCSPSFAANDSKKAKAIARSSVSCPQHSAYFEEE